MTDARLWNNRQSLGVAALISTAALWGTNHVVARAVNETVALPALVFWRWLPAALLLTIVALPSLRRSKDAIQQSLGRLALDGAVGVGIFSYLLLGGAYASPAVEVGIINATTPVWVTLLGLMLGTARPSMPGIAGLALALLGTIVIISKGRVGDLLGLHFGAGNLLSLVGAMTFAWFSLQVRQWTRAIEPLALTVVTAWSGIVIVMLPAYVTSIAIGGPLLLTADGTLSAAMAAVIYMALGPTMLGNLFYLFGVSTVGPQRAAIFLYLSPVFSAALAIGWLDESLAWYHAVGVILILAGLWAVQRPANLDR